MTVSKQDIDDMSKLMHLVYNYFKIWKIDNLKEYILHKDNITEEEDIIILEQLKNLYPQGEVLEYFTNSYDLQCVITKNPKKKRVTLVFRGSDSIKDYFIDLYFFKKTLQDGSKVHSGFYYQLFRDNSFDNITNYLEIFLSNHKEYDIFISGHSLGSGLGILYSYLLAKKLPSKIIKIIGFASPRVGDYQFKNSYNQLKNLQLYRISYNYDIVTAIPIWGYHHVGENYWFDKINDNWDYHDKNNPKNYSIYKFNSISDHKTINYIKSIRKLNLKSMFTRQKLTITNKENKNTKDIIKISLFLFSLFGFYLVLTEVNLC